jgi:hypothetical protein
MIWHDLLFLAGCASFVYGVSQFDVPAAWIVAGTMMILIAVRMASNATRKTPPKKTVD